MNILNPTPGLLLHCGAELVGRETLNAVPTPRGTETWFPLSHRSLLNEVESQLRTSGFRIESETHSLSHEGARYFGVLSISQQNRWQADYTWVVGLRNSHDQSFPAGLVAGSRVFCCDNLAFCGEVKISRKHTKFAQRDLRHLTARAVGQLGDRLLTLDQRVTAYKSKPVEDWLAHDLTIRAVDCAAITPVQIPHVLQEWRQPVHQEFRDRSAWSLFNAFTEVYKQVNPHTVLKRGEALHGLFDSLVGLN